MSRSHNVACQAGGSTAAQTELNKKKEYEVARLRKDIEEMRIQQESLVTGMKKKQQDSMTELPSSPR